MRELMARLGVRSWDELVGRVDFLRPRIQDAHKVSMLDFASLLKPAWMLENVGGGKCSNTCCTTKQMHGTENHLDLKIWPEVRDALANLKRSDEDVQ